MQLPTLSKDEKQTLARLLKKLGVLPHNPCQITLHCNESMVQGLEFSKIMIR